MATKCLFGYILNGNQYIMNISYDSSNINNILKREIFIIFKKFNNDLNIIRKEFSKIKYKHKKEPTDKEIRKLKYFTDLTVYNKNNNDWNCLLKKCEMSYIFLLESGHILVNEEEDKSNKYQFIWNIDTNKIEYTFNNNDNHSTMIENLNINDLLKDKNMNELYTEKTYNEIIKEFKKKYEERDYKNIEIRNIINELIDVKKYMESKNNIKKFLQKYCLDINCNITELEHKLKSNQSLYSQKFFDEKIELLKII